MSTKLPERDKREIGLFRFFVQQNVFLNIVYVGVFILGVYLWFNVMNREAFGNFDFDLVQVTTPYPGATAQEVEQLITMPLETNLKPLEGIDEMFSVSVEGLSLITLKLDPDHGDNQKTVRLIEREVDQVRTSDLPEDGDEPRVNEITAAFPVLTIGISGDLPNDVIRRTVDDLEDDLLNIDGISRVNKKGYKEKEIWVEADLAKLQANYLSLSDIIQSIRDGDHTSPGGRLELGGKEIIVRTIGKIETVQDVERVVVRSNEQGRAILIKDIAHVEERLERERKFTRLNGSRSIELNVLKKDSGDTIKITKEIKALVERYKQERDPNIIYGFSNEISFYIERRLSVLIKNGLVGIFLVLLIMFLFLTPQSAIWSTSAIPFAFLGGLITMYLTGLTVNLLSLFAFILVSGMLVDNGIVVAEYIERKRAEGLPTFTAAVVGISEMSLPVFAAALTTIIAFGPLAFMSGITGKFLRQMPLVLIACLISDLIECVFILPGHLYHYNWKAKLPQRIQKIRQSAQAGLAWVTQKYIQTIRHVIRWPKLTLVLVVLLCATSVLILKHRFRFVLFPNIIDVFVIKYELPVGSNLKESEKVAILFEDVVQTLPQDEIESIVTQVGSQGDRNRSNSGTNVGEVRVFLNKSKANRIDGNVLIEQIRSDVVKVAERTNLVKYELEKLRGGPPIGRAIELQLIGKSYQDILQLSDEIQEFLNNLEGTIGITDDYDQGKDEIRLKINRPAVARAGLSIAQVATVVRAAFDGQEATEIKRVGETEDVSVKVKLPEEKRETRQTLNQLMITTPRGKLVPLKTLINIEEGRGLLTILRLDGERTITVRGDVNAQTLTSAQANAKLEKFLQENIKDYPRVRYKFGGEKKDQDESMQSLYRAIAIALGLIYLVLATLFKSYWKPVIILSIVPFALLGIFLSLMVSGKPVTLLVLIGFSGLTGVVVNNSILLIETFRRVKEQFGLSDEETVLKATEERLRPILLTSLSTFFGVAPLGYGIGGKEPFLQDMAYSFGWGLLICSFITLVWVPAFHLASINFTKRVISALFFGRIKDNHGRQNS